MNNTHPTPPPQAAERSEVSAPEHSTTRSSSKRPSRQLNFPLIVIVLSIAALTVAAVLRILTPPPETIVTTDFAVTNYDQTRSTFKQISFVGSPITVPDSFHIYQAQNSPGTAQELVTRIVREYQLPPEGSRDEYWLGERQSITKNNYENNYMFINVGTQERNQVPLLTSEAVDACLNFYRKYELLLGLRVQTDDIIYFSAGFEPVQVDPSQAVLAHIPLTYVLDGYPLYLANHDDYPFFCRVNNYYELERVVFRDLFQTWQSVRELPSLSIDQAVANIKDGQASIIRAESRIAFIIDLNWIDHAELTAVKIEYRYDETLRVAYPFYNFTARLTNSAGINIDANIITPAVRSATQ